MKLAGPVAQLQFQQTGGPAELGGRQRRHIGMALDPNLGMIDLFPFLFGDLFKRWNEMGVQPAQRAQMGMAPKETKLPCLTKAVRLIAAHQLMHDDIVTEGVLFGQAFADGELAGGKQFFIRVEPKNPIARGLSKSEVPRRGKIFLPGHWADLRSQVGGDFDGAVVRTGIGHDNLVGNVAHGA